MKLNQSEKNVSIAAAKAGMSENTARKYLKSQQLPSDMKKDRFWRTREDPFEDVWDKIKEKLEVNPSLEAKTLFKWLQGEYRGKYSDGQLRTFQRKVKNWRATEGPAKEVFFPQQHKPGKLSESDFTNMNHLRITINYEPFYHLLYHFVLTYSNWEAVSICFSESFESLSAGLQNALWILGGVPEEHQTDRLTTAVQKASHPEEFTRNYAALLKHYKLKGKKIQTGKANENGDVEQRHFRLKKAVDQALLLRGSRNFESREEYEAFLYKLINQLNAGRKERFKEELKVLRELPPKRLEAYTSFTVRVRTSSTIRVKKNVYSVHSRLIGEEVTVRLFGDYLEVWYGQKKIETIPRLFGERKHSIQYRHIIDWLLRKPGAFENFKYRNELFPTSHFRMAYDFIKQHNPCRANKEYLKILQLAAQNTESGVNDAIYWLINQDRVVSFEAVEAIISTKQSLPQARDLELEEINLGHYDSLLNFKEVRDE
jgi:hypothetical protein